MTEGESLFLQGKIDEAYEVLEKEKTGRALYLLGLIEREGYGHRKADEEKSGQFFDEGKKLGDPLCGISLFQGETGKAMWDTVNQDFSRVLLSANHGDVLAMDEAGLFYIGGGVILDDCPPSHKRHQPEVIRALTIREGGSAGAQLQQLVEEYGYALPTAQTLAQRRAYAASEGIAPPGRFRR